MNNKKTLQNNPIMHRFLNESSTFDKESGVSIAQYKEIIRNSLQTLLNAKCSNNQLSELWPEAMSTGLSYGINNFVSIKENIKLNKSVLCKQIEHAIKTYEPRLTNICVSQTDSLGKKNVIGINIAELNNLFSNC